METSRSVVSTKLRLQAIDALRRARRLPIGPHRNDLRQLAIGLRVLELRERQEPGDMELVALPEHAAAKASMIAANQQAG